MHGARGTGLPAAASGQRGAQAQAQARHAGPRAGLRALGWSSRARSRSNFADAGRLLCGFFSHLFIWGGHWCCASISIPRVVVFSCVFWLRRAAACWMLLRVRTRFFCLRATQNNAISRTNRNRNTPPLLAPPCCAERRAPLALAFGFAFACCFRARGDGDNPPAPCLRNAPPGGHATRRCYSSISSSQPYFVDQL